jgi:hypothetical protein
LLYVKDQDGDLAEIEVLLIGDISIGGQEQVEARFFGCVEQVAVS